MEILDKITGKAELPQPQPPQSQVQQSSEYTTWLAQVAA
jgi:hypothetical protein